MDNTGVAAVCQGGANFFGWAGGAAVGTMSVGMPAAGTATVDLVRFRLIFD